MSSKTKGKPAAKDKHSQQGDVPQALEQPLPIWPSLSPLIPSDQLSIETVLDNQILVIRKLFTNRLCKSLVAFLSTLPLVTTPGKPRRGEATRVNDRYQVEDPQFANLLWSQSALRELVTAFDPKEMWCGSILGLNPNIRVYRYKPGQFFDKHYDESNKLEFGKGKLPARTTWTLLIYLSTCKGGETVFYPEASLKKNEKTPEPIVCGLEPGMALLHNHDDCMLHEGREVTEGEKWVLRSDIVVQR